MTEVERTAAQALVAICAVIVIDTPRGEDLRFWQRELRALLPALEDCPETMVPLRVAATAMAQASGPQIGNPFARLRFEMELHYRRAAADRIERFRDAAGAGVVEP